MDQTSKQLVGETRQPLPLLPGEPERYMSTSVMARPTSSCLPGRWVDGGT